MARLAQVKLTDTVLDPCAGTGGFLIAAAYEAQADAERSGSPMTWQEVIDQVKNKLYGFEAEPLTAALCVVNMVRHFARTPCIAIRCSTCV